MYVYTATKKLCKDDRVMRFCCAILMQYRYDPTNMIQRHIQRGVADAVPKLRTKARPISSLPKISPCSPGSRWMTFGLRRAKMSG